MAALPPPAPFAPLVIAMNAAIGGQIVTQADLAAATAPLATQAQLTAATIALQAQMAAMQAQLLQQMQAQLAAATIALQAQMAAMQCRRSSCSRCRRSTTRPS